MRGLKLLAETICETVVVIVLMLGCIVLGYLFYGLPF